jgi:hypothetical protein
MADYKISDVLNNVRRGMDILGSGMSMYGQIQKNRKSTYEQILENLHTTGGGVNEQQIQGIQKHTGINIKDLTVKRDDQGNRWFYTRPQLEKTFNTVFQSADPKSAMADPRIAEQVRLYLGATGGDENISNVDQLMRYAPLLTMEQQKSRHLLKEGTLPGLKSWGQASQLPPTGYREYGEDKEKYTGFQQSKFKPEKSITERVSDLKALTTARKDTEKLYETPKKTDDEKLAFEEKKFKLKEELEGRKGRVINTIGRKKGFKVKDVPMGNNKVVRRIRTKNKKEYDDLNKELAKLGYQIVDAPPEEKMWGVYEEDKYVDIEPLEKKEVKKPPPKKEKVTPPKGAKPTGKTVKGKPAFRLPNGDIWTP